MPPVDPLPCSGYAKVGQYNIALLLLDDVGVNCISGYNLGAMVATPNIDALMVRGIKIDKAWAQPVCSPSRANILTGKLNLVTGLGSVIRPPGFFHSYAAACAEWELPWSETTLADRLRAAGYATGQFGKWHLTHPCPDATGYDMIRQGAGFDRAAGWPFLFNARANGAGDTETGTGYLFNPASPGGRAMGFPRIVDGLIDNASAPCAGSLTNASGSPQDYCANYITTQMADDVIAWTQAETAAQVPWFAFVCFHSIHAPLTWPPYELHNQVEYYPDPYPAYPDFAGLPIQPGDMINEINADIAPAQMAVKPWYKAMIQAMDTEIGRIVGSFPPNTMIIVMGDNGSDAIAGSDGNTVEAPFDPARAKGTVYETGVWVPLIISGPLVKYPDRSVNRLAHACDLHQTILEMAGLPQVAGLDSSVSLMPYLSGVNSVEVRGSMITEFFTPTADPALLSSTPMTEHHVGVMQATANGAPGYKLVRHRVIASAYQSPPDGVELYDLSTDPFELTNLLAGPLSPAAQAAYDALWAKYVNYLESAGLAP